MSAAPAGSFEAGAPYEEQIEVKQEGYDHRGFADDETEDDSRGGHPTEEELDKKAVLEAEERARQSAGVATSVCSVSSAYCHDELD